MNKTTKKKKIGLFLSANPEHGGTFQYNLAILNAFAALSKKKYDLVVAYSDSRWRDIIATHSLAGIAVKLGLPSRIAALLWRESGLPMVWWQRWSGSLLPAARQLRQHGCALWVFPSQDCWSYQFALPSLVSVLDLMHRYESRFPEVSAWGRYRSLERHYRNICSWSKAVLVDSELGKIQVHESYGMSMSGIYVLPYTAPQYIYENSAGHGFDERYHLPSKFVFYPAQFWEHKNHIRLLQAIALVRKKCPDIRLVLVGSRKNAYKKILQEISSLKLEKNVFFLGYIPESDLSGFYCRARALVMPTFFGPTNIPPLEAMALGCPVAISNIYGMPEQVGDAALLFDPESVEEISHCIFRLWCEDDLCAELIRKGKARSSGWGITSFNRTFLSIVAKLTNPYGMLR